MAKYTRPDSGDSSNSSRTPPPKLGADSRDRVSENILSRASGEAPVSRAVPPKSVSGLEKVPHIHSGRVDLSASERVSMQRRLGELLYSSPATWANKQQKQQIIADRVLSRSTSMGKRNFKAVSRGDLELMAYQYDGMFFDGLALPLAASYGLSFRLSSRMTRAGGKTTRTVYPPTPKGPGRTHYEIALSTTLLFQSFRESDDSIRVCGYDCEDRLTAMQRIVEHELVHLCEMLVWIQSDCAANRFQSIARSMFGHTEHRHELITQQERAAKDFNIRAGARVAFRFEGKTLVGVVNRITRRATILVEDSRGQRFSDGRYYLKYYVPIQQLRPIS